MLSTCRAFLPTLAARRNRLRPPCRFAFLGLAIAGVIYISWGLVYEPLGGILGIGARVSHEWYLTGEQQMLGDDGMLVAAGQSAERGCLLCCGNWPIDDSWFEPRNSAAVLFPLPSPKIQSGDSICLRIVLPPNQSVVNNNSYTPLPGYPLDSVIVDLVSNDPLQITVPVRLKAAPHYLNNHRQFVHVYEGQVSLHDPGEYRVDARVEWRHAQWNCEPPLEFVKSPETVLLNGSSIAKSGVGTPPVVTVERDDQRLLPLDRYFELPLCTTMDEPGRWVPTSALPRSPRGQTDDNAGGLDGFYSLPPVAEDGRVFVPYRCRYRTVTYKEFVTTSHDQFPVIHWFGDSNSRRAMRMFQTGGAYCANERDQRERIDCLCNDYPKDLYEDNVYNKGPTPHLYRVYADGIDSREVAEPDFVDDRHKRDSFVHIYYRFTKGITNEAGAYWREAINADSLRKYPAPSIVIYQGTTWDVYLKRFDEFTREVDDLISVLQTVYAKDTLFIYRTGQFWCCRPYGLTDESRRFTRLRFQAYNEYMQYQFVRRLNATVWDVMHLGETRHPETKRSPTNLPCLSGHSRSELVMLENQLLMNALCNQQFHRHSRSVV